MSARNVLYVLLGLVAIAAAVLSFSALRDLAVDCGFDVRLAWLLPVVIDAGAAAGAVAWLGRREGQGHRFGRHLALVLLATSVAGNALGHFLHAYQVAPQWWVVVVVSAVAPSVLGAVVHLAVLIGRPVEEPPVLVLEDEVPALSLDWPQPPEPQPPTHLDAPSDDLAPAVQAITQENAGRGTLMKKHGLTERQARDLLAQHKPAVTNGRPR